MKLSKPRIAAGGAITAAELANYLYKLTDELDTQLAEQQKRIDEIISKLGKASSASDSTPDANTAYETLSADVGALYQTTQALSLKTKSLEAWSEDFAEYVDAGFSSIEGRLDDLT